MSKKTENQNRAWLETKLKNYLGFDNMKAKTRSKIKDCNSYGHRKRQETIVKDIKEIISEFESNIETN